MSDLLLIDGSRGEGGGQILRSGLALSVATSRPFQIENIRAGRKKPGLLRQHLAAVRAATAISGAQVEGAYLGSKALTFQPGPVRGGDFELAIGSSGSAMLVLQTVLAPLLLAHTPSRVIVQGGTHNPSAPPFEAFANSFLPLLRRMGVNVTVELLSFGFQAAGGGQVVLNIEPLKEAQELDLHDRGAVVRQEADIVIAHLDRQIAEREAAALLGNLGWSRKQCKIRDVPNSPGPGNVLHVCCHFEHITEIFTAFGRRGVSGQRLAKLLARDALQYLERAAPVGRLLADQLLLPLALFGGGSFTTVEPSNHTRTNVETLNAFLGPCVRMEPLNSDQSWRVSVDSWR